MINGSIILKLNRHFKLYIIEEDETFNKFYAHFSNIMNYFYNLGRLICEEKQIEKIITSHPKIFHAKVTVIESRYEPRELIAINLVADLQVFELHHILPRQGQTIGGKGKSITLKTTKGSGSSKEVYTVINSDESLVLMNKKYLCQPRSSPNSLNQ